jgi:large repetitive protein
LVMLDGTYIVTDNEGKYSICGVKPQTHVIKVDRSTLPKGSRLLPSSNRNAGVGDSIFVDIKGGELGRADFIEGSCSPEVLDQVKARRAQGGVLAPEKELRPDLKIENRPLEVQQQILPSVRPATTGGALQ